MSPSMHLPQSELRRRDFMMFLAGAMVASPTETAAQQSDHTRQIGVLMGIGENDPEAKPRLEGLENVSKNSDGRAIVFTWIVAGRLVISTEHDCSQSKSSSSNQMSSSSTALQQSKHYVS